MGFSYTLSSEGSTDQMLLPVIDWLLSEHTDSAFDGRWANPYIFDNAGKEVATRISQSLKYYPCDLLFVHRDTDGSEFQVRKREIELAVEGARVGSPVLAVVPIRMTEAWFLFDEGAIRSAADNPGGRSVISLPNHAAAQRRADPKEILERALVDASEARGRRLADFRRSLGTRKVLVSQRIEDYSPLRAHGSFLDLEESVISFANQLKRARA